MKWLFAILVALNIIVFGSMVASKLMHSNTTSAQPQAAQQSQPTVPTTAAPVSTEPASAPLVTVNVPMAASAASAASAVKAVPKTDSKTQADAAAKAKAQADTAAKAKADAANNTGTPASSNINCSATTVLPEDDYHRIKGLLSRWPHAASRFVEQNQAAPKPAPSRVRYMVSVNGGTDVRERLRAQGFETAMNGGQLSLGVFNRRADAETLLARAKINGFSQAQITQLGGNDSNTPANTGLSVAKMRVTFIRVDDQAAQDITQVIQRYGRLQRAACK